MNSLNLLPDEIKYEIDLSKKNARLKQHLYRTIAVFFSICGLISVLFYSLHLQRVEALNQKSIATKEIESSNELFTKATDLNGRLILITKIENDNINWRKVLDETSKVTPVNVQINSLELISGDKRAKLTGVADSDQSIVALSQNMNSSDYFDFVDIESIIKGTDTKNQNREVKSFVISFSLNLEKAKE